MDITVRRRIRELTDAGLDYQQAMLLATFEFGVGHSDVSVVLEDGSSVPVDQLTDDERARYGLGPKQRAG